MENLTNHEAFFRAYDANADAIFRHCYLSIWNRERAKELMQETFMKTWEYLASGHEIQNLKAFLYRTATNLIIDHVRRRKESSLDALNEEYGFDPAADETPRLENVIAGKEVFKILEKLEAPYRDAIIMRYVNELSPKEIAEITGETENVVSVHIHRGLKKLRNLLPHD